jgi:hypothetical protein
MYSKQEAAKLKEEFWTAFGQYMAPILSAEGEKINWINYKTGEKHIQFRMQSDNKKASIGIELSHIDPDIQQLYFEQFVQLKKIFQSIVEEEWLWVQQVANDHGKIISRIYTEINGVSIFKKNDWPKLISFFKPRIILLDEFWSNVKYSFEALR